MTATAGQITLTSPGLEPVTAALASGTPGFTGGTGGWGTIPRRKRKSLTDWDGVEPYAQELALEFGDRGMNASGDIDGVSVQSMVDRLERLAQAIDGEPHPPIVRVTGFVRGTHLDWVIADEISWGSWRKTATGVLTYQEATIRLMEYVPGEIVVTRNTKPRGPSHRTPPSYRIHVSKRNETLQTLAAHYYKKSSLWRKIADAQQPKLRDGSKKLKPGTRIRIP